MGMMDHYMEVILKPNPMVMEATKGYMAQLRETLTPEAYASLFYETYLKIETTINKCVNDAIRAKHQAEDEAYRKNQTGNQEISKGF